MKATISERERPLFVESRDGRLRGKAFAKQTLGIYRAALKRRSDGRRSGYGSAYRRQLVLSCVVLRKYLRTFNLNLV